MDKGRYPTDLDAWKALKAHYGEMRGRSLTELFAKDGGRAERFTLDAGKLTLDYSKNHVNAITRKLFGQLARGANVPSAIKAISRLKDPEKRSRYDRFGSAWQQAQTTGGPAIATVAA